MTQKQSLLQLTTHYLELAQHLVKNKDSPPSEQVLECLVSRDRIAYLWKKQGPVETEATCLIDQGDHLLREVAEPISHMEELRDWQQSFSPPADAWWWHFTPSPGLSERFDWLWTALALALLTVSLSLVANISSRFLSGGPDTWGAFAIVAQSVLTLLTTSSVLTKAGREAGKRVIGNFKFLKPFWEEAGFVASAFLLIALVIFHRSLPQIARWYNNSGYANYQVGQLTSAQRDYERALKLDPNLVQAHYNLGLIYEDLNDVEKAQAEYQIAVQGGLDVAYNNLARLIILDEENDKAIPLLVNGLKHAQDAEVRYDLYKNLGWARLGQARYDEALVALQEAIELAPDKAPAYCLLAQVLQAQESEQKVIDDTWQACLQYGDSSRPDEDAWLGLARQHFEEQESRQGGE